MPRVRPGARPLAVALAGAALSLLAVAVPLGPARAAASYLPAPGRMLPPYPLRVKEFAFLKEGDYFHVFWMRTDPTANPDSTERDLGHAVSRDLVHWSQLPPILQARPDQWDNFHIWAPSINKVGNTFHLYYTGVTRVPYGWNLYQRIGLATSTDLVNWTRYDAPVLSGSMLPWVDADSSTFAGCQFRDPFFMPDPNVPGRSLLFFVAVPNGARDQLIVGSAQSTDLVHWSDLGPLWATDAAHFWGWCESPHLIQHNGLWYLFTTTTSGHPIGFRTAPSPTADSTQWSGKYRVYDMSGGDIMTDAWFGSEALSTPGHDYFAVINSANFSLEFYEIGWGTPPNFTFLAPILTAGVPAATGGGFSLVAEAPTGGGPGRLLRATLPGRAEARLELFDVAGRRVRTLHAGPLPAGESVVAWDGHLDGGDPAPAGVYFASLHTPDGRRVARVGVAR
jgi:hypothetical protein